MRKTIAQKNQVFLLTLKYEKTANFILSTACYYVFIDELQFVQGFEKVLIGLTRQSSIDMYATESNSKSLSTDVWTEFRGRGDEIRVFPLSFSEFYSSFEGTKENAWHEYSTYGGLPLILTRKTDDLKSQYLKKVLEKTYFADIVERNHLHCVDTLDILLTILASLTGSLTNPYS